jgi:DNA-binding transcriptional regulator LsrR (DeoR family)
MPRPLDPFTDRKAEHAAFLRAQGLSQAEIAARLNATQSNVSRWLRRAEHVLGCLNVEVRRTFVESKVTPERLAELRGTRDDTLLNAVRRMQAHSGVRVRNIRVLEDVRTETSSDSFQVELARFGRFAAPRVMELIARSKTVAVTWGSTLSVLIDGLGASPRHPADPPITFFPVCAEPEEYVAARESSSVIAARLDAIVNGGQGRQLALARIPAFIPKRFVGAKRRGIEEMMYSSNPYREIFGTRQHRGAPSPGLVDTATTLLTSVGHADHPMGFNYGELLRSGEISADRLKRLVVGDIGGVLIRRPGLAKRDKQAVDALSAMWTGLNYDALLKLAIRASTGGEPGVVVVSTGANRAEILHAVLSSGLVNEAILDAEAADALQARLNVSR